MLAILMFIRLNNIIVTTVKKKNCGFASYQNL